MVMRRDNTDRAHTVIYSKNTFLKNSGNEYDNFCEGSELHETAIYQMIIFSER